MRWIEFRLPDGRNMTFNKDQIEGFTPHESEVGCWLFTSGRDVHVSDPYTTVKQRMFHPNGLLSDEPIQPDSY